MNFKFRIGITFGAQFCSAYLLAHFSISIAALGNIIPVLGIIFAIFMLGESMEPIQWVACVIVLGAVVLSQYFQSKTRPKPIPPVKEEISTD
ncbi:MAG: EamA family transporter [Desulfovibrionaceae bacterium]|nr:EamA family transporter [Desulfovibrionaceae bacterium]